MKRIISLILALAVIMSSFGAFSREYLPLYEHMDDVFRFDVGEFIEDDETGEGELSLNMKRIMLLNTLGIWDDVEKGESALVTMTEFSIIMSKLRLGAGNAVENVYELNPNQENATYRNAYAYLLEALGYSYRCAQYQNSDEALLIVSNQIGLISENPESIGAFITRGELSKLIAKALTIDMCVMEITSTGGYKYTVAEGKTLLNTVHGIYEIGGFVNAIPGLAVYGGSSLRDGYIQIDRRNVNTSGLDLSAFFGTRVTAYATYDENLKEYSIIFMDYAEDYTAIEIDFTDIVEIKNDTITYVDDENIEQDIDVAGLSYITENGTGVKSIYEMSDFETNEGKIILTASEEKGDINTAIIYKYNYYVSAYADTRQYRLGLNFRQQYEGNEYIQLDEKAEIVVYADGVKTTFEQLPAGAAFRVFQCKDTGYTEIIAKTTKITGAVEMIYDDKVQVLETEYRLTSDLLNHIEYCKNTPSISYSQKVRELQLGSTTTYYVFDDLVVCYSSSQEYKYGYLKVVSQARTGIDPDLTLRILTQDGEWVDFKVTKSIEVDGEKGVSKEKLIARINNNLNIMNNIVRYKANGDNELLALDTIEESQYEAESTDDVEFVYNFNYLLNWTYEWLKIDCPYFLSASTVIFVAPAGETDEDSFRVVKNTSLPTGSDASKSSIPMKFYNPNDFNQVGAAICTMDLADVGQSGGSGNNYYVESIRNALISKEDQTYGYKIVCKQLVTGAAPERKGYLQEASFYVSEDLLDKNNVNPGEDGYDSQKVIEVGDLINASVTGGTALTWNMVLKGGVVPTPSLPGDDVKDYQNISTTAAYILGTVKAIDTVSGLTLIESDGTKYPVYQNVKAMIDPVNKEIIQGSLADFYVGDVVYIYANYGRATYIIKNITQ